ncbi:MAG: GvpL/GvpF family gas vesicle protein [Candidatus Omnitrophica bacterium]|nr:GvpL/GvpF family gas vesicle protein [Candidatus Omnitrophota bacterium]
MKSRGESLIYLYCVSAEKPKLNEAEGLVDNVCFISYQGLYPVFSRVSPDEFSEKNLKKNLADLEWIKTKACNHEKVIEAVIKNSCLPRARRRQACVIPFKLGTLFHSEENLKAMLKKHKGEFKDTLKWLEGKEEWGLKIYCDGDKLKENLIQKDKELLDLDRQISAALPGKAFILKKKKAELLNTIVNKKLNESGQDSFERLRQYSISSGINKLLPKEVTERKDEMILNAVFLINKNKAADLADAVKEIKALYAGWGLSFDCTGPWPPYNFTTIEKA